MTLSKKLNGAFLGITIFVLLLMLGLARWSFERGFIEYVNAIETQRLNQLSDMLGELYVAEGNSWQSMTRGQFNWMVHMSAVMTLPDLPLGPPPRQRPPRGDRAGPARPGPPPYDRALRDRQAKQSPNEQVGTVPGGPPIKGAPPTELRDMAGNIIIPAGLEQLKGKPITVPVVVNGKSVGMLLTAPRRHFKSAEETAFSRQQLVTSLLAALICLGLAVLVAFVVSGRILGPVRQMIANVSRLSKGEYSVRLNANRSDELGQLMADMDRLAFSLEKNQSSRQRWIADISHELRTPITVVTGELEAIKDGIRPFDNNQLMSIDQEIGRLRRLIDDLYQLSLSDIGGLRYRFESFDLADFIEQSCEPFSERCQKRGLTLTVVVPASLSFTGDPQRLLQLVTNLLENAIAYTDAPGQIAVTLQQNDQQAQLLISDSAPTVPADMCEQLFEPLHRQDSSRQRRESGAGLGLAICKNIVEAHHGSISSKPSKLGGIEVSVALPMSSN